MTLGADHRNCRAMKAQWRRIVFGGFSEFIPVFGVDKFKLLGIMQGDLFIAADNQAFQVFRA